MIRRIVPPLPAVSRPSNTTMILAPDAVTHCCMATSSPCRRRISASYSFFFIGGRAALAASNSSIPAGGIVASSVADVLGDSFSLAFLAFLADFLPMWDPFVSARRRVCTWSVGVG